MTTILPPPGRNTPEGHAAISRQFVAHAREQLALGHRLQASEKVWGAAVHALKSVAMQRGWRHGHHSFVFAIAEQLREEYDRPAFASKLRTADSMHGNFYSNEQGESAINDSIDEIELFINEAEELRAAPPRPFTVRSNADVNRLQSLTGRRVKIGDHSDTGFVQPQRRRRRRSSNGNEQG